MKKTVSLVVSIFLMMSLSACISDTENQSNETILESEQVKLEQNESSVEHLNSETKDYTPDITFTTVDRDGNEWTEMAFANQKLTMINFWEPWCPACVEEMPGLNKLYEEYKDQGLLILGVYGSDNSSTDQEVADTIKNTGATYPNLNYCQEFSDWSSGFLPTTVFIDENGNVVRDLVIGARSYEAWAKIVEELL